MWDSDLALRWHTCLFSCKLFAFASSDVFLPNLGQAQAREFMAAVSRLLYGPQTDSEQDAGLFTGSMFQSRTARISILNRLCGVLLAGHRTDCLTQTLLECLPLFGVWVESVSSA